MLSEELVLKCFPNKEAVYQNIEDAKVAGSKIHYVLPPNNRQIPYSMTLIKEALDNGNIQFAIDEANAHNYNCMAQAIAIHWRENRPPN